MGIPLSTTTVTVLRSPPSSQYDDPYGEAPERASVYARVPAVIDHPGGSLELGGAQQNIATYGLKCDRVLLDYRDLIRDDTTGREYRIVWYLTYPDHSEAGLRDVEGEV